MNKHKDKRYNEYKTKLKDILYCKGIYPKCKGVYRITNKITGMFYIGSSNSIYKRFACHLLSLEYKNHANYRISKDYAIHGKDSFILDIVEKCSNSTSRTAIYVLEQKYIDTLNPTYNIQLVVDIPNKPKHPPQARAGSRIKRLPCIEPSYGRYETKKQKRIRLKKKQKIKLMPNDIKRRNKAKRKLKNFDEIKAFNDKVKEMNLKRKNQ